METVPLQNIQFRPDTAGNATEIPPRDEGLRLPRIDSPTAGWHIGNPDGLGTFVPLTAKEAATLPELNFKPLGIKFWYLVSIQIWFIACFSGSGVLVFLGQTQSALLHLRLQYSYALWLYSPSIVGFLTTVLWRGTLQTYNRIIPYSHMAKPIVAERNQDQRAFSNEPLNSIPGGEVHFGVISSLFQRGDYLSCAVNITPLLVLFLTPIKTGIIQLVKDDAGWGIRISVGFGLTAMVIYLWLFLVTFGIMLFFSKNRTGLKWNPCTLATQASLIQGSNILHRFASISTEKRAPLTAAVKSWPEEGLRLHLGYWKEQKSGMVIHGVRFLQDDKTYTSLLAGATEISQPRPTPRSFNPVWPPMEGDVETGTHIDGVANGGSNTPLRNVSHTATQENSVLDLERGAHNLDEQDRYDNYRIIEDSIGGATQRWSTSKSGSRPGVSRLWNSLLSDTYLVIVTILGSSALIAATVAWAKGSIRHSFSVFQSEGVDPDGMRRIFIRGIVFSLLPDFLFGIFHTSFLGADIYQRTMAPIVNMANPLDEENHARYYPGEGDIKGAMGKDSMLIDYVSLNVVSCITAALGNSDYKIVLGLLLATFCNSAFIVTGRIFAFVEMPSPGGGVYFVVTIQKRNFFAAFAIMIVYIISLWIFRPHGVVRTCRPIFTLMDFALLVHQSPVLQCPEFWLQGPSDTEDHLHAQVTLADRVYRYGVYKGYGDDEYLGIAPHSTPYVWNQAAAFAGADVTFPSLHYSIKLARDVLRDGLYDDTRYKYAWNLLSSGVETEAGCVRVRTNEYPSWRKGFRRSGAARTNKRSHEDEASTTSAYESPRPLFRPGSYQRVSLIEPSAPGPEAARTE